MSVDDLNSASFVEELQDGSEEAFECLVDRLLPPLFWFLTLRMNVPEATAEEVAARVLMAVDGKVKNFRFDSRAKLATWIFEIAKNRAIDFHRERQLALQELKVFATSAEQPVDETNSSRDDAQMRWLLMELSQFSDQDQQILKWRALDFLLGQIAKRLDMTEGTARVRHKRALDKFKRQTLHHDLRMGGPEIQLQ